MHFLVDSSLPRSAAALLRQMGHEAVDARDVGMRSAPDDIVAAHAQRNQQVLITRDFDFADIRNYPPTTSGSWCLSFPTTPPPPRS